MYFYPFLSPFVSRRLFWPSYSIQVPFLVDENGRGPDSGAEKDEIF